jgi:hypothetical protein
MWVLMLIPKLIHPRLSKNPLQKSNPELYRVPNEMFSPSAYRNSTNPWPQIYLSAYPTRRIEGFESMGSKRIWLKTGTFGDVFVSFYTAATSTQSSQILPK